jgi:hypothetical protein
VLYLAEDEPFEMHIFPLTVCAGRSADDMEPFHDLDRWADIEQEMVREGIPLPLEHRASWIRDISDSQYRFFVVRDEGSGSLGAATAVRRNETRTLPGHYYARATRFGHGQNTESLTSLLASLRAWVGHDPRLLGVRVEIFEGDDERREALDAAAADLGYARASDPRRYARTARVDLAPTEEELLASFSASCRRFIRDPAKKGYRVEPVTDERWASRMHELFVETFARTGGGMRPPDWSRLIAYANEHPDLFRIVGTFGPDYPDEGSLVAFASARNNGDHAEYADSASTRRLGTTVAVHYAPMWELMRWAKSCGCAWFDLGGITGGTQGSDDPVGGISDFKRRFQGREIDVGHEWTFEPTTVRTRLAEGVRAVAALARRG